MSECVVINQHYNLPPLADVSNVASLVRMPEAACEGFMVNRMSRKVALVKNKMFETIDLCMNHSIKSVDLANINAQLAHFLSLAPVATAGIDSSFLMDDSTHQDPPAFAEV